MDPEETRLQAEAERVGAAHTAAKDVHDLARQRWLDARAAGDIAARDAAEKVYLASQPPWLAADAARQAAERAIRDHRHRAALAKRPLRREPHGHPKADAPVQQTAEALAGTAAWADDKPAEK